MAKPVFLILVSMFFTTMVSAQSSKLRLLDKFDRIPCSDFRGRIDNLMAEVASYPRSIGYVALSANGNYLDVFRRRNMIATQLEWRNFDSKRIVFVRRKDLAPLEVEFLIGEPGAKLEADNDLAWPYELPRRVKPFVLITGGFDASECPSARDAEFVARLLKANEGSRANIVIKCRGRNCFREMRREFTRDIVSRSGSHRPRLRFYYIPIETEYYEYEFWVLL